MWINAYIQRNHIVFTTISCRGNILLSHMSHNYLIFTFSQGEQTPKGTGGTSLILPFVSPQSLLSQVLQRRSQAWPSRGTFYSKGKELPREESHAHHFFHPQVLLQLQSYHLLLIHSLLKCQHARNGSQYIYCCSPFSSITIQQMYQQHGLVYLLYVDSSQECSPGATLGRRRTASQLTQGTTPRPGVEFPTGPQWIHTQIPPQDWMHFRTWFKIILPINIISILCALLNSAEMDGWTTVHTWTQSIQICFTWQLGDIKNSYYSMTVLGLRHASGQALPSLKEISINMQPGNGKTKKTTRKNPPTVTWHHPEAFPTVKLMRHSEQKFLKPHYKW